MKETESTMKKFLGAFTAIATTFANQAASAVEHKSVQPTRRTPQVAQPITQQQQIAQINRKLYPNVMPS